MAVIPPSPLAQSHTPIAPPPEGDYRANRLFRHMAREEIEALAQQIEHLNYGKGELILQRLDETGGIHLLLKGALLANQYSRSGREVGYRRIAAGSYFGEISAIDGLPRSVNIVALEDTRVARLPQPLIQTLFEQSPRFMRAILEDLASLTRSLTDRLFELSAVSVACRVDIELLRMAAMAGGDGQQATIHPCPTHAELAVLVGSQREAVTRELNRLAGLKIVSQTGRTLRVLNVPALADEIERIGGEV
ncbi:Crp/Fnr family transcriptional regulator [Caulobacter sp. ErkDOM-YI]|uniref:Crp/Fnr family transcriptional regulator n=1 Tax=unclassified Caulobacter TaxID=2648921 RepID=UPI003AF5CA8C